MFFKKFVVGVLLVFGLNGSLYATDEIIMTKALVTHYVEDIGEPATNALVSNLTKLFGDVNNPSVTHFYIEIAKKELSTIIYGAITALGISTISKNVIDLNVKQALMTIVKKSSFSAVNKPTMTSISKGMIIGIIQDIAKDVIQNVVYKTTNSRVLSGAAVALVEQSVIYLTSNGNLYVILASESELLFSRLYDIGNHFYEIDQIQNQGVWINFEFDLKQLQIINSKKYSVSNDDIPSTKLLNEIYTEVDNIVDKYRSEYNMYDEGENFKENINLKLLLHKISVRYDALNNLRALKDWDRYQQYLNDYFSEDKRHYYKYLYSAYVPFYSDVDVKSTLHTQLRILTVADKIPYIRTVSKFNPNETIWGGELASWLDKVLERLEKIDSKTYSRFKLDVLINDSEDIDNLKFMEVQDTFYREIYGLDYVDCLPTPLEREKARFYAKKRLKQLGYKDKTDTEDNDKELFRAIERYASVMQPNDKKRLRVFPSYLTDPKQRESLIDFSVYFLSEHAKNKDKMLDCKD